MDEEASARPGVNGNPNLGFYFTMFVSNALNLGTANLFAKGCNEKEVQGVMSWVYILWKI
jgi:hypothetical protein